MSPGKAFATGPGAGALRLDHGSGNSMRTGRRKS